MLALCRAACYFVGPRSPIINVASVVVWMLLGIALVIGPPRRLERITGIAAHDFRMLEIQSINIEDGGKGGVGDKQASAQIGR